MCVFFGSKGNLLFFFLLFYFTAAGVKYRVAAVKRLPIHHHSADHIIIFFWDHLARSGYFENQMPLKPALRGGAYTA